MRIRVFLVFLLPLLFLLLLIWMIVRYVRRRKRLIHADSVAEGTVTDVRSKPVSKEIYHFTAVLDLKNQTRFYHSLDRLIDLFLFCLIVLYRQQIAGSMR